MKNALKKLGAICLAAALFAGLVTSCAKAPESATPIPAQITDQLGRAVTVKASPQRIVSLAPSNTEILFALGLSDRIVAVTDYCNYPPEAKTKPSIGGFSTPNIEEVIAKNPDLILAADIHKDKVIPPLEAKGLTVIALNPKTIDEVITSIELVGKVTGKEKEAADLAANMQKRIKVVTEKTGKLSPEQQPSTCFVVWHDPLMIANFGTLQDELIKKAGGSNTVGLLSSKSGYAEISLETFLAANPAVMIAGVGMGTGEDLPLQFLTSETRLADTDARRNNRIYSIDQDLVGRAGPRIVEALEQFARFIHPELFK